MAAWDILGDTILSQLPLLESLELRFDHHVTIALPFHLCRKAQEGFPDVFERWWGAVRSGRRRTRGSFCTPR